MGSDKSAITILLCLKNRLPKWIRKMIVDMYLSPLYAKVEYVLSLMRCQYPKTIFRAKRRPEGTVFSIWNRARQQTHIICWENGKVTWDTT